MTSGTRDLLAKVTFDFSDYEAKVQAFEARMAKASSPMSSGGGGKGSGGKGGGGTRASQIEQDEKVLDRYLNKIQAGQLKEQQGIQDLNRALEKKRSIIQTLESQKGVSAELAQEKRELASILDAQRKRTTDEAEYIKLLKEGVAARKEASKLTEKPKTEEKESIREAIAGAVGAVGRRFGIPTVELGIKGLIAGKKGGSAGGGSGGGGAAGEAAEGGEAEAAAGGLGGAAVVGLGVAGGAIAIKAVFDKLSELGKAFEENAKIVGDSGGQYDKVRQSAERLKEAQDKLSNSEGAGKFEELKNNFLAGATDFLGGVLGAFGNIAKGIGDVANFLTGNQDSTDPKEVAKKKYLTGAAKEQNDKFKTEKSEMGRDQTQAREALEHDIANKRRDLAIESAEFEIGQARKVADERKKMVREEEDYQKEKSRIIEDLDFKASENKRQIDVAAKERDFSNKQSDEKADYNRDRKYSKEDFKTKQGDDSQDFGLSQGRRDEDYKYQQYDMARSGASGLDRLKAARQHRIENQRAAQDFSIKESREKREFDKTDKRDAEKFGTKQDREKRDFKNTTSDEAKKHAIDVDLHYAMVKRQLIDLEIKHARAIQDSIEALKRIGEDTDMGRKKLKNRADDDNYNAGVGRRDLKQSQDKQNRNFKESYGGFAKSLRDQLGEDGFNDISKDDPDLKDALDGEYTRQGLDPSDPYGLKAADAKKRAAEEKKQKAAYQGVPRDMGQSRSMSQKDLDENTKNPSDAAQAAAVANGSPKGIPTKTSPEVQKGLSMGLKGTKLADYLEQQGYDVSNTPMDSLMDSHAVGGFIDQDKIAQLHKGEYVVNPARKDNLTLLQKAADQMGYKLMDIGPDGRGGDSALDNPMRRYQSLLGGLMSNTGVGGGGSDGSGGGGSDGGGGMASSLLGGVNLERMKLELAQLNAQNAAGTGDNHLHFEAPDLSGMGGSGGAASGIGADWEQTVRGFGDRTKAALSGSSSANIAALMLQNELQGSRRG